MAHRWQRGTGRAAYPVAPFTNSVAHGTMREGNNVISSADELVHDRRILRAWAPQQKRSVPAPGNENFFLRLFNRAQWR